MMAIGCVFFLKMCIFVLDELKIWNDESKIKTFAVSKDIDRSEFLAEFATFEVEFLVYHVTPKFSFNIIYNVCLYIL